MIIGNLVGGLGNQMFQYACARALALELGYPLKVTQDMFGLYTVHNGPELERVFWLQLDAAQPAELRRMTGRLRVAPVVRKALATRALATLRGCRFIVEPHYRYWGGLLDRARNGAYLQGYWQSERYFSHRADALRKDFAFRQVPGGENGDLARAVQNCQSVSIHVRRGDYVGNAKTLASHGTCTPDYYFNAIERMRQHVPALRLFAFSDDPQWVADVLKPKYPDLVSVAHNQGENSYNDMQLMSLCRHHIIANSSFSWWGAWLNPRLDKMVIAPARWFANGTDTRDLIPEGWGRL